MASRSAGIALRQARVARANDGEEALARLLLRVSSEDAKLLATAVAVQRRTGGNLVEVLGQMAAMLRERERLRRDVRVLTTAPRSVPVGIARIKGVGPKTAEIFLREVPDSAIGSG